MWEQQRVVDVLTHAFRHVYHQDHANAAMHCSEVRYSPITFRLAEMIDDFAPNSTQEVMVVMEHRGKYEEDKGR